MKVGLMNSWLLAPRGRTPVPLDARALTSTREAWPRVGHTRHPLGQTLRDIYLHLRTRHRHLILVQAAPLSSSLAFALGF
jgi:hypothetical protein